LKRLNVWTVAVAVVMAACLILGSASAAFAADPMTLSVSPDKTAVSVGDTVTYTYVITNNSTDNITNLVLSDNKVGSVTLSSTNLNPGENVTATKSYVVIAGDLPGPINNTATAAGIVGAADNITATGSAVVTVNPLNAQVQVVKAADRTSAAAGDNITYNYQITNSGNAALTGLSLTDSKLGAIALSATSLAVGENVTAARKYTVVAGDFPGPLTNTANVTAISPTGATITAASNLVSVALTTSSIGIVKSADKSSAAVGDNITYTYTITNTGNTVLNTIVVADSKLGGIAIGVASLAAGENTTANMTYTVISSDLPGPLTNTANVTANASSGTAVTATSNEVSITLTSPEPENSTIAIVKSADRAAAVVGDSIKYTFTITNTGDTALTGLVLTDSKLGAVALSVISLAAGSNTVASMSYKVVDSDLPGPLSNTATVTAVAPSGTTVTATSGIVSVKLTSEKEGRTKSEVLKDRGVPGKGIDNAPGLQKPFNPKSQAFENAGQKDEDKDKDKDKEKAEKQNNGNGKHNK
jgi:uncharacterized repeat protein (TIGR01451 family)